MGAIFSPFILRQQALVSINITVALTPSIAPGFNLLTLLCALTFQTAAAVMQLQYK